MPPVNIKKLLSEIESEGTFSDLMFLWTQVYKAS